MLLHRVLHVTNQDFRVNLPPKNSFSSSSLRGISGCGGTASHSRSRSRPFSVIE